MNGIEVLERLKADSALAAYPVIMISGLSETDAVIRCIEAGAEDYLPKPFDLVLLRARINAGLERKRWRDREREYLRQPQRGEGAVGGAARATSCPTRRPAPQRRRDDDRRPLRPEVTILFADIVGFTPDGRSDVASPSRRAGSTGSSRPSTRWRRASASRRSRRSATPTWPPPGCLSRGPTMPSSWRHSRSACSSALERHERRRRRAPRFSIRIGIHTGPVVAGIIGRHKFIYDVWGDTVNIASRLESQGVAGRIQVSESIQTALSETYRFEGRGNIALKGKGETENLPGEASPRGKAERFAEGL